ncbi:glutamate receptor 1-like [Vespula pensylvanica]|uniref:glutamate receptor 1-like n=1 Tax=Vespula pensylvanica TaxID=30213 RepID=UPI001CBA426F|nr:glutamate receptor 1-like [Vespula pensylvanica]
MLYELHFIGDQQIPFIIDICKLNGPRSAIFLYSESIKEMEMKTMMFKWMRALSREGVASTKLHFSQLHQSSYYVKEIARPYYIALISNFNAINEFSLATNTFDMSSAVWLVIFIYEENSTDYCHNPPGNIFHLRFNSEMLVRCGTENILREWYSIDTNRIEIMDVATWSLDKGITKMVPDFLYERRYNLQGFIMKAVTVKSSSFTNVKKGGESYSMYREIFRELCVTLNFSLEIVSEAEEYGRWNPEEKSWTGAIAELYAGRADISLSGFSITSARLNAVDFTHPVFKTKNFLVIREPEKFGIKWSSYFQTFTNTVWIAILGILMTASILLIFPKIKSGIDRKIGYLFIDNFLEIWGIFCQQGLADFSGGSSLRIAYFSIFLLVTVLSAAYSASLISLLTSLSLILPFDSFESFVKEGTHRLTVIRGTADYDKFANSADPLSKNVMKLMLEEEKLPLNVQEGFKNICKNRNLAIYLLDQDYIVNLKIPCSVVRIATGDVTNFALILSKHNPFTGIINFQLQKFLKNGIMHRIKDSTFKKKSFHIMNYQPVPLISLISLLMLILTGIVFSICILIIEKFIFIRKTKKRSMVHHISSIK